MPLQLRIPECGVSELSACPWMHREPAPQAAVIRPMFTCFVSGVPAAHTCCPLPNTGLLPPRNIYLVLSAVSPLPFLCLVNLELWAHRVHSSFFCNQWTMTLKSNKNEPALILDSVNSMRTALSDLYLEQLLQNKPKSDKVNLFWWFWLIFA